jgi:tRNA A37 threonylcarbamoyladenosine dehydratase
MPGDNGELYARQEQIGLTIPPNITVVGCGGIGSWFAILAAMSGVGTVYLFDHDVMEESNRNRLPFCQSSLNRPKVDVVGEYIRSIRPDCVVIAINGKLEGVLLEIQLKISGIIVDCTDSPKTQYTIYNACKKMGNMFIRVGYDGTRIMVTSNVSGWIKTDVEEEAYTTNPSWVVPAVTAAALGVGKMMKYFNQEVSTDISEIGIPVLQRVRRLTPRCNQENVGTIRRRR